ncbi:MAG: tRNA uridine-5-carboxymethylaminomethyl(34) synthesis GTPase MnmE [Xanthomonadales bacterium]|nr:tRNA uridine-5-carboxymethylaminomethyl(34) synthesis GTPase MnmE [Xanthomonadales bacterium]
MCERDTIAALASGAGRAGIGVVRVSGPDALDLGRRLTGRVLVPRRAQFVRFRDGDGQVLDDGLAIAFPGPASFTGEDVVELHGHGNPVLLQALLDRLYALGARPARPGEFSERAFLAGRLDLAQAEAVADLVAAGSLAAARAARRSLDGVFSRQVHELLDALVALRVEVEAGIDFPEEELELLAGGALAGRLDAARRRLAALLAAARHGQRLRDGQVVVLAGRPNAGKSSLLNRLAGSERAIVTPVPGTTRDVLREEIRLGEVGLTLVDTAGLREAGDAIEAEGVRRARAELARADHVLHVRDAADPEADPGPVAALPDGAGLTAVLNKIDLLAADTRAAALARAAGGGGTVLAVSAQTGEGIDALVDHLARLAGATGAGEGAFSARARHVEALQRTATRLDDAYRHLTDEQAFELCAEALRLAHLALGEITGSHTPDDLLGAIFSSFCIGK